MDLIKRKISAQFQRPIGELNQINKKLTKAMNDASLIASAVRDLRLIMKEFRFMLKFYQNSLNRPAVMPIQTRAPLPTGRLSEICHAAGLKVVDIGGRLGPVDSFALFAPFAHLFTCEPDAAAAAALIRGMNSSKVWKEVTLLPEALSAQKGTVRLNLTKQPGLSSLKEPNRQIVRRFYRTDEWEVVGQTDVASLTLDEAAQKYGFEDLTLIKLDTQGTELEILKSGTGSVLPNVMGVYIEMENLPFYQQQPCFTEVDQFLRSQGFTLIDLKRTSLRRATSTSPIYSKREFSWAHGLYFRLGEETIADLSYQQALKLFCLAILLEYFDLAVSLLETPKFTQLFSDQFGENLTDEVLNYSSNVWKSLNEVVPLENDTRLEFSSRDRQWER